MYVSLSEQLGDADIDKDTGGDVLRSREGIAVGFVDGDLELVWHERQSPAAASSIVASAPLTNAAWMVEMVSIELFYKLASVSTRYLPFYIHFEAGHGATRSMPALSMR